jgi:3-deoxy-manno-octulosonate cytidylyltransferase (CMP-KDO synthetase)
VGGRVVAVIPSRYASTRFPGKPLADIAGVPMVARVARQVRASRAVDAVIVATDDDRIARVAREVGVEAVMTDPNCASGTDRVWAAAHAAHLLNSALILNVQGDEPLIDPLDVDAVIEETLRSGAGLGTLARPLVSLPGGSARFHDENVVKVVTTADGSALYFSRAPIPFGGAAPLAHIGIYAYRPAVLERLSALPPSPLERSERLEQLRALENGIRIHVAQARSTRPSVAVDVPADIDKVIALLKGTEENATP